MTNSILSPILKGNEFDYGLYRIVGTVARLGVAGVYRVRLFDHRTARCIYETWSDNQGHYAFNYLTSNYSYFVIAFDGIPDSLNAAIADLVIPEPMP